MLDSIKRLSALVNPGPWAEVQRWAHTQKMSFTRFENQAGFGVEGLLQNRPWRMAWSLPERPYIEGSELRMRLDMGLGAELQILLMCKTLSEKLAQHAFERFTQTNQTLIDENSPEEVRWLVMFPTASYQACPAVQQRFHLVGNSPLEAAHWVEGELAGPLEHSLSTFLTQDHPFLVMVINSRVYLRVRLIEPTLSNVLQVLSVFEAAVAQAFQTALLAGQEP
jgi:hypothetical protein